VALDFFRPRHKCRQTRNMAAVSQDLRKKHRSFQRLGPILTLEMSIIVHKVRFPCRKSEVSGYFHPDKSASPDHVELKRFTYHTGIHSWAWPPGQSWPVELRCSTLNTVNGRRAANP
jgi:hypothetical protein